MILLGRDGFFAFSSFYMARSNQKQNNQDQCVAMETGRSRLEQETQPVGGGGREHPGGLWCQNLLFDI